MLTHRTTRGFFIQGFPLKLRLFLEAQKGDGGNPVISRQKIDLETASMGRLLHQRGAVVDQDGWTPPRGEHLAMGKPVSPARSVPIKSKGGTPRSLAGCVDRIYLHTSQDFAR